MNISIAKFQQGVDKKDGIFITSTYIWHLKSCNIHYIVLLHCIPPRNIYTHFNNYQFEPSPCEEKSKSIKNQNVQR